MMQQLARQQQQQNQSQNQQQNQNFGNAMSSFMGNQGQSGMSSQQQSLSGQNSMGSSVGSRPMQQNLSQSNDNRQNQHPALQRTPSQGSQAHSVHSQGLRQQQQTQQQSVGQNMQNAFGSQNQHGDSLRNSFNAGQMGQMMSDLSGSRHSTNQQQMQPGQETTTNMGDASTHSHQSGGSGNNGGNMSLSGLREVASHLQSQKSFLDGNFEGGWQSNADIPDRRRVIFSILDVIRQSHGLGDDVSNK